MAWRLLVSYATRPSAGGRVACSTSPSAPSGRIDQVLVFELAGDRAAGLYGVAYRILERAQILPATVMATLFPVLALARTTDMERMRRVFRLGGELLLLCSLPFVAFTAVAGDSLIRLLFGEEFTAAAPALAILMAAFVVVSVGYMAGFTVIVLDLQKRFVRYALIGLVFNIAAKFVLIPRYWFVAAAWTTLATQTIVIVPTFRAIFVEIQFELPLGRLVRMLAAAGALTALLAVLDGGGVPFGGLTLAALLAYPALAVGLRAVDVAEVRGLLGREPGVR